MPRSRTAAAFGAVAAVTLLLVVLPRATLAQEGERQQPPPVEQPDVTSAEPRPGVDLSNPPAPPPLTPTREAPASPTPEPSGEGSGVGPAGVSFPIAGDVTRTGPFNIVMNASYNQSSTATVNFSGVTYTFTDSGGLLAGPGCSQGDDFTVFCDVSDAVTIDVFLGSGPSDGNDSAFLYRVDSIDALNLTGGEGNDAVHIGAPGLAGFGTVSVFGTSGSDTLLIDDSFNSSAATYTLSTGSIQRDSIPAISHSAFDGLSVQTGSNDDNISVNSSTDGVPTAIYGGVGNDTLTIGTGFLDTVEGAIFAIGGDGTDTVTLQDASNSFGDPWNITSTILAREFFGGLNYDNTLEGITLNAGGGSSQFNVASTNIATTSGVVINAGNGNDIISLGPDLDFISTTVTVSGGADIDGLEVTDTANSFADTYNLDGASIARSFFGGVLYSNLEGVTLNAQNQSNLINVDFAGVPHAINANGGNDTVNWGSGLIESFAASTVNGGPGTDAILVQDSGNPEADGYTLTDTSIVRVFSGLLTYGTFESFTLNAASAGNDITAASTATNVNYTLNGLGGNDTLNVGDNLAPIQGPIYFDGGAATDVLNVIDNSSGGGYQYAMRAGRVERLNGTPTRDVDYTNTEAIQLFAGSNGDSVSLMGTSPGTATYVYLGAGTDGVNLFLAGLAGAGLATAQLTGGPDNDVIFVFDGGLGFTNAGGSTIQTPGRHDVQYFEFEAPPNAFGTGTDYDADGCPDAKEGALNPIFGGDRNPFYNYDWFDVTNDKAVDVNDVVAVLQSFGLAPGGPVPGWQQRYDRGPGPAPKLYRNVATTNGIDVADAIANLQSFGHNCN